MELKWTNKALSAIARLYEFLAAVNQPAAARTVQQLTAAPTTLQANPRIGERLEEFDHGMCAEFRSATMKCAMRLQTLLLTCCVYGKPARTADDRNCRVASCLARNACLFQGSSCKLNSCSE